jgi:hypothetical protein
MEKDIKDVEVESRVLVDSYLKDSNIPRTSLYTSISYESLIKDCVSVKDNPLQLEIPGQDRMLPLYSEADLGGWIAEIFQH